MKDELNLDNAFQRHLSDLREGGLIEPELVSPILEDEELIYWDMEELLHSDDAGLYDRLTSWLDSGSNISEDEWSETSGVAGITEKLAWYQPITFYGENAGIFITTRGLQLYGNRHWAQLVSLGVPGWQAIRLALWAAYSQLLNHEMFHHHVEWIAFCFDFTLGRLGSKRYATYSKNDYLSSFSSGALEEALASASELRNFPKANKALALTSQQRRAILATIKRSFVSRPPGYNVAGTSIADRPFKLALGELLNIVEGSKKQPATRLLPQVALQRSELYNYFAKSTTVVEMKSSPSFGALPMTFTVPDRKLKKLLKIRGYEPTNRGKGSHEVWAQPGHQNVTVPRRTNQEGIKFLKSTAKALGLNGLRDLEELVRTIK